MSASDLSVHVLTLVFEAWPLVGLVRPGWLPTEPHRWFCVTAPAPDAKYVPLYACLLFVCLFITRIQGIGLGAKYLGGNCITDWVIFLPQTSLSWRSSGLCIYSDELKTIVYTKFVHGSLPQPFSYLSQIKKNKEWHSLCRQLNKQKQPDKNIIHHHEDSHHRNPGGNLQS